MAHSSIAGTTGEEQEEEEEDLYLVGIGTGRRRRREEGRVLGGGGRDERGELEAEALHVQPPVLLHVLPLQLAAAAAVRGPFPRRRAAAAALPPALHLRLLRVPVPAARTGEFERSGEEAEVVDCGEYGLWRFGWRRVCSGSAGDLGSGVCSFIQRLVGRWHKG